MMAGVVHGIMKRIHGVTGKQKLILGLQGSVMIGMWGYRKEFMAMLSKIQNLEAKRNGDKPIFEIQTVDASNLSNYLGVVALSKYIWVS